MLIGVFGTGRNGSSLIGRLLDGLGDTYVHPVEEKFLTGFDDLKGVGRVTRLVEQNCVGKLLEHLDEENSCGQMAPYFDRNRLNDIFKHCQATVGSPSGVKKLGLCDLLTQRSYRVEDFTREYLHALGRNIRPDVNFKHHLFKSIETAYIAEYEKRFPDMQFIHIVRNPVAVCSSQKRSLMENKGLPASYLGYDWLTCMLDMRWVPHAEFIAQRQDDPRHIVVRYEDLVKDPEAEIGRIASDLGVLAPPRPNVQTIFHDLDKTTWGGNPSKKGLETPTAVVADLQVKNKYDEVLTPREIDLIAVKTRGLLNILGYDSPSDASRTKVMFAYLLLDKWEWKNWKTPLQALRGLYGMVYRRISLFQG